MSEQDSNPGRAGHKACALSHYAVALAFSRKKGKMKAPKVTLYNSRDGLVRAGPFWDNNCTGKAALDYLRTSGPVWPSLALLTSATTCSSCNLIAEILLFPLL